MRVRTRRGQAVAVHGDHRRHWDARPAWHRHRILAADGDAEADDGEGKRERDGAQHVMSPHRPSDRRSPMFRRYESSSVSPMAPESMPSALNEHRAMPSTSKTAHRARLRSATEYASDGG